jgi:hypothetical protein
MSGVGEIKIASYLLIVHKLTDRIDIAVEEESALS